MGLETAILVFVLSLVVLLVASFCLVCVCLTSTPIGGFIAVAFGWMSINYLNSRNRGRRSDYSDSLGVEETGLVRQSNQYHVVPAHSQVVYNQGGDLVAETVAEAYLVAPLSSTAIYTPLHHQSEHGEKVGPNPSAPPLDPSPDSTTVVTSSSTCGDYGMFRDFWCALLFLANVAILTFLAVNQIMESLSSVNTPNDTKTAGMSEEKQDAADLTTIIMTFLGLAAVAILVGGTLYLTLLIRFGEQLITGMIWLSITGFAVGSVVSLVYGQVFGCVISAIMCGLTYWYLLACKERIVFAGAVLKTATSAVKEHYNGLIGTAIFMLFLQTMYVLMWSVAIFSVASHSFTTTTSTDPSTGESISEEEIKPGYAIAMFFMSISLYWGMQVFTNVVASTVSGTVAVWWFQPKREAPVKGSLFRALTTSFGSICLGSLIVAVLHALRNLARSIRNKVQNRDNNRGGRNNANEFALLCVLCLIEWILAQCEMLMQYFNKYAFVYNAAYGTNFATSGSKVMDLFKRRGWTMIINDDLISNVFVLGNLALSLCIATCGVIIGLGVENGVWGSAVGLENAPLILGAMGFVLGLAVGGIMTNIVSSAVASIFVYFAEDPSYLARHHSMLYEELISIWTLIHPQTLYWMPSYSSPGGSSGAPITIARPLTSEIV